MCLQGDNQFNIAPIKGWAGIHDVQLKYTEPYEHNQNAHVERLNQIIGKSLWEIQVDQEIETGKINSDWVSVYPLLIAEINEQRKKTRHLSASLLLPKKERSEEDVHLSKGEVLIEDGTKVRLALLDPENLFGQKQVGAFRSTDHRYRYTPIYQVETHYEPPDGVILYQIINCTTKKRFRHLVPWSRLQVIKD
jgi:hypothetical protein